MTKAIRFIESQLINFTSHRSRTVKYGDITRLSGQNGEGKTSIGTAPAWTLWGVDLFGSKFNPSPTNYEFDRVLASLLLSVDGTPYKFAREIDEKGANVFYLNDVPTKAKEYDAAVASLFDKDEFLSAYNPLYFFGLHWTKQREQIMKHTTAPDKGTVLAEMSRTSPEQKVKDIVHNPAALKLDELTKKHSLSDLQKIHTDAKNKSEKLHIQSQGSVKTLTAQLQAMGPATVIDREVLEAEGAELDKKVKSFDEDRKKTMVRDNEIKAKQAQIDALTQRIEAGKDDYKATEAKRIEQECQTCGQALTDEAKATAEQNRKAALKALALKVNPSIELRKAWREELTQLQPIPEPDYTVTDLVTRIGEINALLHADDSRTKATADLDKAKKDEAAHLQAKNESIFILDAIKAYRATEATLQASKVESLFTRLKPRLFKFVKTTGEYEPDFEIMMDGKNYSALSAGEKIAAGLELTEVLFKQSELIAPVFIDGIESYTGKVAVYDQLITGRAVVGQELRIETEGGVAA